MNLRVIKGSIKDQSSIRAFFPLSTGMLGLQAFSRKWETFGRLRLKVDIGWTECQEFRLPHAGSVILRS
jgi:hypothetical protein